MRKSISFLPTIFCIAVLGAIGYRMGIMPDDRAEDILSFLLWGLSIAAIVGGVYSYLDIEMDKGDSTPLAAARILFWSGAAGIAGYLIGSWP